MATQGDIRVRGRGFDVDVDWQLVNGFRRSVLQALVSVPYGETVSYGELAGMVGNPGAVRAVGRACATNPVALVIPCHRVVREDQSLGGYRWGLDRKQKLLDRERKLRKSATNEK